MGLQSLFPPAVDSWIFKVDPTSILITKSLIEIKWEIKPPEKEGCDWTCGQLEELRYTQKYYLTIEAGCHDSSCDPVKLYGEDVSTPYLWLSLTKNGRKLKREIVFESKATSPNQQSIELVPRNYGVLETSPKPGCPPAYPFDTNTLNVSIISQLAIWSFGLDTIVSGNITDFYLFDADFKNPCGSFSCDGRDPGWYLFFSLGFQDLEIGPAPIKIAPPAPVLTNIFTTAAIQAVIDSAIKLALTAAKVPFTIDKNGSIRLYGQILLTYKIKLCELTCPSGKVVGPTGVCICPPGKVEVNGYCLDSVIPYSVALFDADVFESIEVVQILPASGGSKQVSVRFVRKSGPFTFKDLLRDSNGRVTCYSLPKGYTQQQINAHFSRTSIAPKLYSDPNYITSSNVTAAEFAAGIRWVNRSSGNTYKADEVRNLGKNPGFYSGDSLSYYGCQDIPSIPPPNPPICDQIAINLANANIDFIYTSNWNQAFVSFLAATTAYALIVRNRPKDDPFPLPPVPIFDPPVKPPYQTCP